MAHSFATSSGKLVGSQQQLDDLGSHVLGRSQECAPENTARRRPRIWPAEEKTSGSGPCQGAQARLRPTDPCADLLREQIAMVEAALASGSALDRQIAQAEMRLKQLKTERTNAARTVASLRDALQQVTRSGKPRLEEEPRQQKQRLEHE